MSVEIENQVENEAELDAIIAESIQKVNAGETLVDQKPSQTVETPKAPEPSDKKDDPGTEGATGEADGGSQNVENKGNTEFRVPQQGKFESDEAYEKRVELFDLVKARKAATTPEAKQELSEKIAKTKGDLRALGNPQKVNNLTNINSGEKPNDIDEEDPLLAADRERLKELGGATKEDVAEIIRQERLSQEVSDTVKKFVERTPELKDEDVRDVFFDFVDSNYVWQGKTGKELITTLELARENMFRPNESIQERYIKGAEVQGKINAMSFPGSTGNASVSDLSPDKKQSLEELKATGMSEEKARELLSDD